MLAYALARLREPSTIRGITALLAAGGLIITPEHAEAIVAGAFALIGVIGAVTKDPAS